MLASQKGHLEIVECLLQHGADPNAKTEKGFTSLYIASQNGSSAIVKLLLQHTIIENYKMPLSIACQLGHGEIVRLLIEHGAEINAEKWSPLEIASSMGHLLIVKMLMKKNAIVTLWALEKARQLGHLDIIKYLLQQEDPQEETCVMTDESLDKAKQKDVTDYYYDIMTATPYIEKVNKYVTDVKISLDLHNNIEGFEEDRLARQMNLLLVRG